MIGITGHFVIRTPTGVLIMMLKVRGVHKMPIPDKWVGAQVKSG